VKALKLNLGNDFTKVIVFMEIVRELAAVKLLPMTYIMDNEQNNALFLPLATNVQKKHN